MESFAKTFFAFAVYGVIHSFLLTAFARDALTAVVGPRIFRAFFRLLFSLQAAGLLVVLVVYVAGLPDAELMRAGTYGSVVLWGMRLAAAGFIFRCIADFGFARFLGFEQVGAWRRGEVPVGDGVETGELVTTGPYRVVRHPMYSAVFLVLWAEPHWTANRLAFALAASLYLWLGSLHEERRMLRFYGDDYRRYTAATPRFLPLLRLGRLVAGHQD